MRSVLPTRMPNRWKTALGIALAFQLIGAGVSPLWAYVPPAPQLLRSMEQALGRVPALLVRQQVFFLNGRGTTGGTVLSETLKYEFPDRFRSDIQAESARRTHVVSSGKILVVVDGQIFAETENRYELYKDLFLYNSMPLIAERLTSLGVDASLSSLGRLDGRLVYVLGAKYPDETRPQLWLDKETFRPARWILRPSAGVVAGGLLDIRYTQWRRTGEIWYPWQIHFHLDKVLVRRIQVKDVKLAAKFPAEVFDIDRLKTSVAPKVGAEAKPPPLLEEVQTTIDNFRRLYEQGPSE